MTEYELNGTYTTVEEYAESKGFTPRWVRILINSGKIPNEIIRVGKRLLLIKLK